jgi:hypothetical protein
MKKIQIKFLTMLLVAASLTTFSCSDLLEEETRGVYEPGFFETEQGVQGGLTAMYAHLRYIYGLYYYAHTEVGTDEYTWAESADNNFNDADYSNVGTITYSSSRADVLWNNAFPNINTANGVIENATAVGIDPSLIAEARFFRAFDYFLLVQTFGGVPLDLGAGELKFNNAPSRLSTRNTVPEVYTKAVFPDLLTAVNELPDVPRLTGTVTKTVARLFLAKAYLTYGWWLENPNNIPTYPETARADPDGHDAQWYFQQAYNIAIAGIDNAGSTYGLLEYYYDVNLGSNDRNKEILLYADHTETSAFYNGSVVTGTENGAAPANIAVWFASCNHGLIRTSLSPTEWTPTDPVKRAATQDLGRPWTRMAPTIGVFTSTFKDKTNDSRYDGTFVTTYRGNWNLTGIDATYYNANFLPISPGDAVLSFIDDPETPIVYPPDDSKDYGKSNVGAAELPGRADFVINFGALTRQFYPGLWKLGTYRTDNGSGVGQPNAGVTRPFNIAKFSEFYLIAAEAAVKGATGNRSARDLVNVLRARAGKWYWDNNGNAPKEVDNSAAMVAATPAQIDINYILEERSREFFGEGYRWLDLVRTQKWNELAGTYRMGGEYGYEHTVTTTTRNIQPGHYLQPIPEGQINGLEMDKAGKDNYQNPQYRTN